MNPIPADSSKAEAARPMAVAFALILHEVGELLPSGVRFAFVPAAEATRQLVLRRDLEAFFGAA